MLKQTSRLVFIHIPKTGGSSLSWIIDNYYGERAERLMTAGDISNLRRYVNRPAEELEKVKALHGHIPISVASHMPGKSDCVTMLRHPYERVVSDYFFIYSSPQHPAYQRAQSGELSFEKFIRGGHARNVMTRRLYNYDLAGEVVFTSEDPHDQLISVAKENLKQFAVVGLNEFFDESVRRIADHFQWEHIPEIVRINTTKDRPKFSDLSDEDQEVIRENNILDLELYEEAKAAFMSQ